MWLLGVEHKPAAVDADSTEDAVSAAAAVLTCDPERLNADMLSCETAINFRSPGLGCNPSCLFLVLQHREALLDFSSRLWFTYRRDFASIGELCWLVWWALSRAACVRVCESGQIATHTGRSVPRLQGTLG